MTQIEAARKGVITPQMNEVAEDEGLLPEEIRELVASGAVVIPHNIHHDFRAIGIGRRLRTKVNANIGASNFHQLVSEEVEKLYTAVELLDLLAHQLMEIRRTDIGVDFGSQSASDADRAKIVMDIMRDNHRSGGHQLTNFLGQQTLVLRHFVH